MDDLAAFLAARYDEAEATARASYYEGQHWLSEEEDVYRWPDDEPVHSADRKADARFIADVQPKHRLADIKLKRAILAEHPHCRVDYSMTLRTDLDEPFGCSTCDWDRDYGQGGEGWCATVRQLGTEFSDHPDYKPGWRPDDTAAAAP